MAINREISKPLSTQKVELTKSNMYKIQPFRTNYNKSQNLNTAPQSELLSVKLELIKRSTHKTRTTYHHN